MGKKNHFCFKNWNGTSTAMKSDIILEAFKHSISSHRLKYAFLVGDGDSSVLKKLQIECFNHLLRNYCNNLKNLSKKKFIAKGFSIACHLRQALKNGTQQLRTAVLLNTEDSKTCLLYTR